MIYNFNDLESITVENVRGGEGKCILFKQPNLPDNLIMHAMIKILPNSSIGYHQHVNDYEIIYVLDGEGTVNMDGEKKKIMKNESSICFKGHFHSLTNDSPNDLIILAFVGK